MTRPRPREREQRNENRLPAARFPEMNDVEFAACEQSLAIDRNDLDEHLIAQPQLFSDVGDKFARAVSVRDMARDDLRSVESTITLRVKREHDARNEKCTEKIIDAHVQNDVERRNAFQKLVTAQYEVERWEGLKESYRQRASMLRDLCSLYIANYYTKQSVTGGPSNGVRDAEYDQQRKKMAQMRQAERSR